MIRFLAFGGTIASVRRPGAAEVTPTLSGTELVESLPELAEVAEIDVRDFPPIASFIGSEGKWCIHPNQIEWANTAFTPSRKLCEEAERVLAAHAEATATGRGATLHEGKMIDEATRKLAERLVAAGSAAGLGGRDSSA